MLKTLLLPLALSCTFFKSPIKAQQEQQLVGAVQSLSAIVEPKMETAIFNLINQQRATNFLKPLIWSSAAALEARNHSLNMANKVVPFSHQGAEIRFANLRKIISSLVRFGENVAYNKGYTNPTAQAVSGWMASPGHYANIMGDFNITGVGVAKNLQGEYYFTQIFLKTTSSPKLQLEIEEELLDKNACESLQGEALLFEIDPNSLF